MSHLSEALDLDGRDELVAAAEKYEAAAAEGSADDQSLLNLALVYFTMTDGGYVAALHLTNDYVSRISSRAREILKDLLKSRLANEAEFWLGFLDFIDGLDSQRSTWEQMVRSGRTIVPAFWLYDRSQTQWQAEADHILRDVQQGRTARERYIRSVLNPKLGIRSPRVRRE